jgi:hypothetical protein
MSLWFVENIHRWIKADIEQVKGWLRDSVLTKELLWLWEDIRLLTKTHRHSC